MNGSHTLKIVDQNDGLSGSLLTVEAPNKLPVSHLSILLHEREINTSQSGFSHDYLCVLLCVARPNSLLIWEWKLPFIEHQL